MARLWALGSIVLVAALLPPQLAQAGGDRLPDRIALPKGWQPEGITTDRRSLYVGSLADGGIWVIDAKTGEGDLLEPGVPGRVGVGVDYDRRRDLLWVAGGPTNEVRAHDADTGDVVRTYSFPHSTGRFLNDLVVTRRGVFTTDSVNQELAVVPLKRHGRGLPPASRATTLPLTGDLVYTEGFNLNGIVRSDGRLLAVQGNTGFLFRIDPRTGDTDRLDLDGVLLTSGDGLEIDDDTLYVVRNAADLISVVELDDDLDEGELEGEITDAGDDFDVPTTAALARDQLWVVSARFGTTPTENTPYWISRVPEFDD